MEQWSSIVFRSSVTKYHLLASLLLIVASNSGCSPKTAIPLYWLETSSLYVNQSPYSQLYVEVDRIEGVRLDEQYIEELKSFLGQYTDKPDGVVIRIDDPIPFREFEHVPIHWASILAMDGPVDESASRSAYLHVFAHSRKEGNIRGSFVSPLCPNTVFWCCESKRQRLYSLKHEVEHVLGLAFMSGHDTLGHCDNRGCLMAARPDLANYWRFQFGGRIKGEPCKDCVSDNLQLRGTSQEDDIAFSGPFFFRREKEYAVAYLPGSYTIVPTSKISKFDWVSELNKIKRYIRKTTSEGEDRFDNIIRWRYETLDAGLSLDEKKRFLDAALKDSFPYVRLIAEKALKEQEDSASPETEGPRSLDLGSPFTHLVRMAKRSRNRSDGNCCALAQEGSQGILRCGVNSLVRVCPGSSVLFHPTGPATARRE